MMSYYFGLAIRSLRRNRLLTALMVLTLALGIGAWMTTLTVLRGVVLAVAANLYLVRHYEVGHLPWSYLASSVLALWVLGQVAVLGPALRAAAVPPVVATRSV